MTHPEIEKMMKDFGVTKQEAMFIVAVELGVISGDVTEPGEPEGEELDRAVITALNAKHK